ncbi:MAG: hypothetical protein HQ485_06615 [Acidobacteria bacterium]|nr:hypothetical protein [Acidobacteriota bacterium]
MAFLPMDQVPVFLLLMLPGFISRKVYDLQISGDRHDGTSYAMDAVVYGTLNAAIWIAPLTWAATFQHSHPVWFWTLVLTALVASPVALAIVAVWVLRSKHLRGWTRHPMPMAWDYYFGQGVPCWVLFRLKNGKSIGGFFGAKSFASSYPHGRDIYIEQSWVVDDTGHFVRAVPDSAGALVSFDECELIEFFQTLPESREDPADA